MSNTRRIFELRPLLVAAGLGAVILVILSRQGRAVIPGALIGAGVQVGVRALGVS